MSKFCWLQVSIGGKPLRENIVVELFDDVTPKTCENFRKLCTGNDGKTVDGTSTPMTFKGCTFHRIIAGFMIQGGDFTKHDGTGGVSIYGERFADENFEVPCDKAGLLAMANAGADTNGSQFFITVNPAPHLTGKHVVFGKVVRGMSSVRALENAETGANDRPLQPCVVDDCGVADTLPDPVPQVGGDLFPDYPSDCSPALTDAGLLTAGEELRQIGNNLFKAADFENAVEKYQKAARFVKASNKTTANALAIDEKLVACFNNTAACALKLSRWSEARSAATQVLDLDPKNSKALFRRGVASLSAGDAESAVADLAQAQTMDPENVEIAAKLQQAKEIEKTKKAKLSANLKKMFS